MATSAALSTMQYIASPYRTYTGVVVSAGKMQKTIKVRVAKQKWDKKIQKFFDNPATHMVHDPNSSCHEGDVVSIRSGWRVAKNVRHVVTSIIAPMGPPLSERPPVPTETERLEVRERKRAAKDLRQAGRGRKVSAERLREREKLERRAAHETWVEMMKKRKEERIARQLAEGKGPDEEIIRLQGALGELKREKAAQRMKKLAEARVLCRKMYEEMDMRQRVRMRKLDWMIAVLNDASPFAVILDMMQSGKNKEEIMAQGVNASQYDESESIVKQILSHAHNYLAKQSAVWKRAAQVIAAGEKAANMNDDANEKAAIYGISIEDLKQPRLPESRAAAQKLLDAAIVLPGIESIDPKASLQQQISQAQEMLPQFVEQARRLRMQVDGKSGVGDNITFDSDILEAAAAHYEDMVLQLKMKIAQLEGFKRFMEKYPNARWNPVKFNIEVQRIASSKSEAARKKFATFHEVHKEAKTTTESNENRGNAVNPAKREMDAIHDGSMQNKVDARAAILHGGAKVQHTENGNMDGDEKESSMKSDFQGVKNNTGLVNELVQENKVEAVNLEDQALKNEGRVKELNTGNEGKENEDKKEGEEKKHGGVFGWFRSS